MSDDEHNPEQESPRRGRGKRGAGKSHKARHYVAMERLVTRMLEKGVTVYDPATGGDKLDEQGKRVYREPSAGHLIAAMKWMTIRSKHEDKLTGTTPIDRAFERLQQLAHERDSGPFQIGGAA